MAVVTYGNGLGPLGFPGDMINYDGLTVVDSTATRHSKVDASGYGAAIEGSAFTYDAEGALTGGEGQRLTFLGPGQTVLYQVEGLALDALDLAQAAFSLGDWEQIVLAGHDLVTGSARRDVIGGMGGNDILFGGRGGDVLIGMHGRDRMTGGDGADQFLFWPNRKADIIMDFADGEDRIAVQRSLYTKMTMTEGVDRVILDFGGTGSLVVLGVTPADIGRDDFTFHDPLG